MSLEKIPSPVLSLTERLKADIIAGRYRPGEWLKQADIESTYGVNRFEVRISLTELTGRQFTEHVPNRGFRVANPNEREREELYELRTILETAAARQVAAKATDEDIAAFQRLVDAFDAAVETGSRSDLRNINLELHDRFYQICGNALLAAQIRELRERRVPGRAGIWDSVAGIRVSAADHREMAEMLRRRDPDGLAQLVYRHLNRWRDRQSAE
jgi:DNA-binding GntR family transcriptional regulator